MCQAIRRHFHSSIWQHGAIGDDQPPASCPGDAQQQHVSRSRQPEYYSQTDRGRTIHAYGLRRKAQTRAPIIDAAFSRGTDAELRPTNLRYRSRCCQQWSVDRPFVARSAMQELTMRVILQAVFGLDDGPRLQALRPLLASFVDMTNSPVRSSMLFFDWMQQDWGSWSPWGRMKQRQRKIDDLIYAEIEERRLQPDTNRTDILSLMMAARDENGQPMTNEELCDELMTLLVAGHETTGIALAWAFYWIHYLPSVRQKLLQELDSRS